MAKRRIHILMSLCLLAIGVAAAIGVSTWVRPLFALQSLKGALEARDEQGVAANVDFSALKANVTEYADARIEQSNEGKVLGGVRSAISKPLAEHKIAGLATPEGLIHLACDTRPDGSVDDTPKPAGTPCAVDASLHSPHYLPNGHFEVKAKRPTQGDMGMILGRGHDGRWRLIGLTGSGPAAK